MKCLFSHSAEMPEVNYPGKHHIQLTTWALWSFSGNVNTVFERWQMLEKNIKDKGYLPGLITV